MAGVHEKDLLRFVIALYDYLVRPAHCPDWKTSRLTNGGSKERILAHSQRANGKDN